MQRSSEHIGAIAAALARAQGELNNPEKSLMATIEWSAGQVSNRTFRYASLASGLDIIRKSLGKQEIATVQTTSIDNEAGLIRLTTVLAHSSGEWVSSDWPVCPVADTAAPRRMGAALTYARRYALFTLVGIAGEDDLDAPDFNSKNEEPGNVQQDETAPRPPNAVAAEQRPMVGRSGFRKAQPMLPEILPASDSAAARDRLLEQLSQVQSADDAAVWARQNLPIKNTLEAADARSIETAFAATLSRVMDDTPNPYAGQVAVEAVHESGGVEKTVARDTPGAAIDHDVARSPPLAPKVIRLRDKEHRQFVSHQPCVVCGRRPSDPHHLRFAQPRALSRKVSDEFVVPVCRLHHREIHRNGDEAAWWAKNGIDPMILARQLWRRTRKNNEGRSFPTAPLRPKKDETKPNGREAK